MTEPDRVGDRYRSAHLRTCDLLSPLDEQQWNTAVPACPGWRVRDVLAHLVGIIEDALAGRLTGPPPPAHTNEQVDRHRDDAPAGLLDTWSLFIFGPTARDLLEPSVSSAPLRPVEAKNP